MNGKPMQWKSEPDPDSPDREQFVGAGRFVIHEHAPEEGEILSRCDCARLFRDVEHFELYDAATDRRVTFFTLEAAKRRAQWLTAVSA